jgi:hypothetical protein
LPKPKAYCTTDLHTCADTQALKKIINSYAAGRPASDASLLSLGLRPAKRPLPQSRGSFQHSVSASASASVSASGHSSQYMSPLSPNTALDTGVHPGESSSPAFTLTSDEGLSIPQSRLSSSTHTNTESNNTNSISLSRPTSIPLDAQIDVDLDGNGAVPPRISGTDQDPLPPETEPPAPSRDTQLQLGVGASSRGGAGRNAKEESFKAHRDVFFFTLQRELEKVSLGQYH